MLIIVILLLAVKLFFQIREVPFSLQFKSLVQAFIVIIVVSCILYIILKIVSYDEKWEENRRKYSDDESVSFFDGWLHNSDTQFVLGLIYVISFMIIFGAIIYRISQGQSYLIVLKIAAIPMIIYDIALMIDFKFNYAQEKLKLPFPLVWLFETICCFIVIAIVLFFVILIAIFVGEVIIIVLMVWFPVLFVIWTLKDHFL